MSKKCVTCGEILPETSFYKVGGRNPYNILRRDCKKCFGRKCAASKKRRYEFWPEGMRESARLATRRRRAKDRASLSDAYIKSLLAMASSSVLCFADIPQELVEMKRAQLLLKRFIAQQAEALRKEPENARETS